MVKKESLKDINSMKLKTTHTLSAIETSAWVIEHNKSFQDIKDVQPSRINKDVTLAKLVKDIQDMSLNLGIEIEAKLRNVLYLSHHTLNQCFKRCWKLW